MSPLARLSCFAALLTSLACIVESPGPEGSAQSEAGVPTAEEREVCANTCMLRSTCSDEVPGDCEEECEGELSNVRVAVSEECAGAIADRRLCDSEKPCDEPDSSSDACAVNEPGIASTACRVPVCREFCDAEVACGQRDAADTCICDWAYILIVIDDASCATVLHAAYACMAGAGCDVETQRSACADELAGAERCGLTVTVEIDE